MKRFVFALMLTLTLGALAGCTKSGAGPATVPVAGRVTFKGQPLADAEIEFINNDEIFASFGKTDAQGNFKLIQGAAPGENRVVIRKLPEGFQNDVENGMDFGQLEAMAMSSRSTASAKKLMESVVPMEYANPESTPLKYMVSTDGASSANFDL